MVAARAGFDSIVFDLSKLPFEENAKQTKQAVEALKSINPDILVEAEIGYIGSSSTIHDAKPQESRSADDPRAGEAVCRRDKDRSLRSFRRHDARNAEVHADRQGAQASRPRKDSGDQIRHEYFFHAARRVGHRQEGTCGRGGSRAESHPHQHGIASGVAPRHRKGAGSDSPTRSLLTGCCRRLTRT